MEQVDAGRANLPQIEFNGISFRDEIQLGAPLWATSWSDSWGVVRRSFIDAETAKWRDAQARYRK